MNKTNEGDLVYIPSGTTLFVLDIQNMPKKIMKLDRPANLLVTNVQNDRYEVLYMNESWLVKKNNTYEVKND
tara:strand:+ start:667 stop:882 length:216 start_codon:yes stop_codon:yes gene_type:complete